MLTMVPAVSVRAHRSAEAIRRRRTDPHEDDLLPRPAQLDFAATNLIGGPFGTNGGCHHALQNENGSLRDLTAARAAIDVLRISR